MPSFSLPTSKDESNHYHSISNVSQRSMLFNTIKITLNWPLVWEYCLLPRIEIFIS